MAADQLRDRLLEAIRGHRKESALQDFIRATALLKDGRMVDKQIAEFLNVTVGEVRNRRKVLRRITSIRELGIIMRRRTT
jgi:hypothetical protein